MVIYAICLLLAACAGQRPQQPPPRWAAPAVEQHAQAWICRITDDCRSIRLRLLDTDAVQATILLGVELTLSRGLYAAVHTETELAFVIAHELAHHALRHRVPRDLRMRLPIELEADQWAARRLCVLGVDPRPGKRLLERMHDGEGALRDAYRAAGLKTDHARNEIALRELEARIRADFACANDEGAHSARAAIALLDDVAFDQLRATALTSGVQPP